MNAKHTPGPWRYNPDRICIESETAWSIEPDPANDEEGSRVSVVHTQGAMGGNVEADLRLIAAAPAMLSALEEAERTLAYFAEHSSSGPLRCMAVKANQQVYGALVAARGA